MTPADSEITYIVDSETGDATVRFSISSLVQYDTDGNRTAPALKDLLDITVKAVDMNGNTTEETVSLQETEGLYVNLVEPGTNTVNFTLYDIIPISGLIKDTSDSEDGTTELKSIAWGVSGQNWAGFLDLENAAAPPDSGIDWTDYDVANPEETPPTYYITDDDYYISHNWGTTRGFNHEFFYYPESMTFSTELFAAKISFHYSSGDRGGGFKRAFYLCGLQSSFG